MLLGWIPRRNRARVCQAHLLSTFCCLHISGLRKLSLLNLLAEGDDVVIASAQTQRLVFLVKHLIQCFQSGIESLNVKAEVIKLLSVILPKLAEIYGSHWADTMEILNSTWKETSGGDEGLSVLYASFRLFGRLRLMANGESNDDFEDAWSESKDDLVRNLVSTLSRIGQLITRSKLSIK